MPQKNNTNKKVQQKRGNGKPRTSTRKGKSTPVVTPMHNPSAKPTNAFHSAGSDVVFFTDDVKTQLGSGYVLADILVLPDTIPNLGKQARTWDKWQPKGMTIQVNPGANTLTKGCYTVAFIQDPDDKVPTQDKTAALSFLQGRPGTRTEKWSQSTTLKVKMGRKNLYTSLATENRLSAAGRLVVISEVDPSESFSCKVTASWDVMFTNPSVQDNPGSDATRASVVDDGVVVWTVGGQAAVKGSPLTGESFRPALPTGSVVLLNRTVVGTDGVGSVTGSALKVTDSGVDVGQWLSSWSDSPNPSAEVALANPGEVFTIVTDLVPSFLARMLATRGQPVLSKSRCGTLRMWRDGLPL
ncbi:hypothetical protein 3 [Sanxia tombus-like virus 9]|uniref:hypothetical protein 3 n=1 Tax=Sanxia tombus-like virus 9 TaxID=1923393 RepID=UPI000909918C|nr:hypothetical protein 3 [Sanxia tombus-like virus 9]APG76437.1 hypothetical protein 3 [Sanxia tombus-like virus 9]